MKPDRSIIDNGTLPGLDDQDSHVVDKGVSQLQREIAW